MLIDLEYKKKVWEMLNSLEEDQVFCIHTKVSPKMIDTFVYLVKWHINEVNNGIEFNENYTKIRKIYVEKSTS